MLASKFATVLGRLAVSTPEIVKLADWDTVKSNVFAKAAIQYVRYLLRQASAKQAIVLYVK